jgi:CRISPR-associated endonuclease/helicase Cas3
VDVPTGLGKTKVIALWLAGRILEADKASGFVPLPRRLVYVVDRRAVVDQATIEAVQVAANLQALLRSDDFEDTDKDRVRARLLLSSKSPHRDDDKDADELAISTLRGQFVDNRKWFQRPHGSAIVVGTVDMIGSRLLFGGYGVSAGMRPVHAGLLGSDTLFVLDESHLVPPFEALMRGVAEHRYSETSDFPVCRPAIMALSATGVGEHKRIFALNESDRSDPAAAARLAAEKHLTIVTPPVDAKALPAALAEKAWELAEGQRRVLVFCNSRKDAQAVEDALRKRCAAEYGPQELTGLLVGERRLRERTLMYESVPGHDPDAVVARFLPQPAESTAPTLPAFLVATSAGEVGVDLDADDIVCDLVAIERMIQRFGRVNRRAIPGVARIVVVPGASEDDLEDEVATGDIARLIAPFELSTWAKYADGTLNASPSGLRHLRDDAARAVVQNASTPTPLYPSLTRPVVESWSMTSLPVHPGRPLVAPWIRGWIDQRPQTRIVWRRHFPLTESDLPERGGSLPSVDVKHELGDFFEAAPPHATEVLEAPTDRVARWLKARFASYTSRATQTETATVVDGVSDGAQSDTDEREATLGERHVPIAVVLDDSLDATLVLTEAFVARRNAAALSRDIAEHVLIVDARLAGLAASGLLDDAEETAPPTLDDQPERWMLPLQIYGQRRVLTTPFTKNESFWRQEGYRWSPEPDRDDDVVLRVEVWRQKDATTGNAAVARRAQGLAEHHDWAGEAAESIAAALDLPDGKKRLLVAAARAHDSGKNRDLWQNAMRARRDNGRPYAKTEGGAVPRELAGYRHEFGSLADMENHAEIRELPEDDRDLALHLIAAHHGRARPFIIPFDPNEPPSLSEERAREIALRFERLQRSIGPWELAWWEALLRAADWMASQRNDEQEGEP